MHRGQRGRAHELPGPLRSGGRLPLPRAHRVPLRLAAASRLPYRKGHSGCRGGRAPDLSVGVRAG
ncbi:hypothetical protein SLNWT_0230 [Streptomyces albus]|uniref:Uncharacterized protein n=1 Tax=Streptomyces albus (strain ATCC 21838 / DSM 41398 / FERM P-419 / JCM 4703 / NBRC 107858) TaxID=1081613 RepID=A0A0B5EP69_STRA4|nr:hypothetical protein SLNWT_0230 [Streptomyces albus]AOU74919.1 hypothetical protein SLNHY_0228 [Streptomyces albus]AYN30730.1 hypothetical protein DUI70_0226 [Streptomyces albus]